MSAWSGQPQVKMREYQNLLSQISNTVFALRHNNLTYEQRFKALDWLKSALADAQRYLIYFQNVKTD